MAMLGADSVAYHEATVIDRVDDHPGQALAYYASRGETPLVWGGSGAHTLGLVGTVTDAQYRALFGEGGAREPVSGARLVSTRRPGIELVVSAHKSVAELGVIGRAEDMHAIVDAERDATLAYLDELVRTMGGRRGRARTVSPTGGLIFASTRHATSRTGDPCPHDHVLIANLVEMRDEAGGWKALDTVQVRDHLHAATMVGRLAAAGRALELGYAIERDDGTSGRLGHWAIVGIPAEVQAAHSTRAAEINEYVHEHGQDSWRARQLAARKTRPVKRHTPVEELLPGWRAQLAALGWPAEQLLADVTDAGAHRHMPGPLTRRDLDALVTEVLDAEGPLGQVKVFHRRDVVVAVAPLLFGRPESEWRRVVDTLLAAPEAIPLARAAGSRGRAWSLASVIATETAIAQTVARGTATADAPVLPEHVVNEAIARTEQLLHSRLNTGQHAAVHGICTAGARISLVLGVAGAGKTTALGCVADAYRTAGYQLLGAATSGQAARTLGREARLDDSRTLASLCWRFEHQQLELSERHVVILDEASMTDDPDLFRLLTAADIAGAKVVLVGDDRQLSPVGPGGAFGALLDRHHARVHVLDDNVRQHDPTERAALAQLRAGNVARAVGWYLAHDRLHVAADRDETLVAMVDAWAADTNAGRHTVMYAWQRRNVDALNQLARDRWRTDGHLTGPELVAPGGRHYQTGDRIVTVAPGRDTLTSEQGHVVDVRPDNQTLIARMDDDRFVRLAGDELDSAHLAYGYAVTVHRAQGATVEIAHRLEDGGGRELAYVALSRARHATHTWVIADTREQAADHLSRDWSTETRARWVIDTNTPTQPSTAAARNPEAEIARAAFEAQRRTLAATVPPDPRRALLLLDNHRHQLADNERDLKSGTGIWTDTPVGEAAHQLNRLRAALRRAEHVTAIRDVKRGVRRAWRANASRLREAEPLVAARFDELAAEARGWITTGRTMLDRTEAMLRTSVAERDRWFEQHPRAMSRLAQHEHDLARSQPEASPMQALGIDIQSAPESVRPYPGRDTGIGLEL